MRMRAAILVLTAALAAGACAQYEVSPETWAAMTRREKEMVVLAQLGGEAAAGAKGGAVGRYERPAGEYVERIDALYAAGEPRSVQQIWPELSE